MSIDRRFITDHFFNATSSSILNILIVMTRSITIIQKVRVFANRKINCFRATSIGHLLVLEQHVSNMLLHHLIQSDTTDLLFLAFSLFSVGCPKGRSEKRERRTQCFIFSLKLR